MLDDLVTGEGDGGKHPAMSLMAVGERFASSAEMEAYEAGPHPLELLLPVPFYNSENTLDDPTETDLEILAALQITVEEWRELIHPWSKAS